MASLVGPLCADHAAAASGTAEFFSMGTATLSSLVYSDANGVTPVTTTTLDASGSAVRYVGEPVDVVLKNATGAQVLAFTHIDDGRVVRVETSPYSGPNTNGNGQTVVGGRTTATAALAQLSLAGATIASGSFQVFNVLSYGANNAGTTDALAAITAACAAANAAGGGRVYLPAGTYKITNKIDLSSYTKVSLIGDGIDVTYIKNYSTSFSGVSISPGSPADVNCEIAWLTIATNTTTSGWGVNIGKASQVHVHHVKVSGHAGGIVCTEAGAPVTHVLVERCQVSLAGVAAPDGAFYSANKHVTFRSCYALGGAASGTDYGFRTIAGAYTTFLDCFADSMATGTARGFFIGNAVTHSTVALCRGSGNDADLEVQSGGATDIALVGNQFATIVDGSTNGTAALTKVLISSSSSAAATFTVTPDFTTFPTNPAQNFSIVGSYAVGAQGLTIANPTLLANVPIGFVIEFTLVKINANVMNITWGNQYLDGDASAITSLPSVASNTQVSCRFRVVSSNTLYLVSIGASGAV